MELIDLLNVKEELARFNRRLLAAIKKVKEDYLVLISGCKETGAVKRAAIDLKNELTNITKS